MDNEYLDIIGLGIFKALNDKRYPILVNGKISESAIPTSITNSITSILSLIPDAASSENKLADKNFVNSSIATNTATFRGTFDDLATLQATSADINDYAFYVHTDEIGNTAYDRYKHNGSAWVFEYTLNNSSFTAEQWSAINSGITTTKVGNYDAHLINYSNPHKVTKSQVGLGNVENVALSSWAGSNKITTLGTITTGVWNGTKIANTYLANSSITIGTTAISLGSTAKSLAGIEKLQLNDANSNLVYDSTTGSWKLTGNLLVTGFISAGAKGNSSSGGGSTYTQREWAEIKIMSASEIGLLASAYSVKEAYNELNTAIETLAGKATNVKFTQTLTSGKQIGTISIDGKSTSLYAPANYAWSEVTGKPSFATVATSGSYTDLTNKPTIASLMGSTAIGGTSSYIYWNGSAWATKALGTAAFASSSDFAAASHTHSNYVDLTSQQTITGNKIFSGAIQVGAIGINTDNVVGLYGYGEDAVEIHAENTLTLCGERNTYIGNADNSAMVDIQEDMAGYNAETGVETWYIYRDGYAEFQSILGALANSLAIKLNGGTTEGTNLFTFNNSASKTINITPSAIGAAAASHTHSYLPLSGGTMSNTNVVTNLNADLLDGLHKSSIFVSNFSTIQSSKLDTYATRQSGTYTVEYPGYTKTLVTFRSIGRASALELLCEFDNSNLLCRTAVDSNKFTGWKTIAFTNSNVASSSKWATARTITLTGSVTGSVSIDGSANVSLATTTNHTHTFASLTDKPTTISGYGITDGLRRVTLANNVENDFNTFENLTLTGRGDPTTGSSLLNSPWTTQPAGGFGVLTYLWSSYGLQLAAGYNSNDLYVRNKYFSAGIGAVWSKRWDKILNSSNYNSYAPKLDGTGATGTWNININGYAGALCKANNITDLNVPSWGLTDGFSINYNTCTNTVSNAPSAVNNANLIMNIQNGKHGSSGQYGWQVGFFNQLNSPYVRRWAAGSVDAWYKLLHSGNYNEFAPSLTGVGASGTWGINISGNAATATDADTLDGVHYQNILERRKSGSAASGTATGWFRIAETLVTNAEGTTFLLAIGRNFYSINNESYLFSISINYSGGISITQLSGYANNRLITKIRVDWTNGQKAYIDLYIASSTNNNNYFWYTVGCAKSYTAWTANPTLVGTAYEFTTVQGCKSDRGFTGDLTGTASKATDADKLDGYHESDFSRHITGTTRTTGTKYFKLGNLPKSNDATWDAFLIQGEIGGWASLQKTVLNVCVGRRNGVAFCGYTQGLWNRNLGIDIGVNDAGEIVLIVTGQYCAWTLDLHTIQGTISYTGTTFTPTDTNFVLLSASNNVSKSLVDGTVEKTTKLANSRTIWGQSFDGTGNVSGALSGVTDITASGNVTTTGSIYGQSGVLAKNASGAALTLSGIQGTSYTYAFYNNSDCGAGVRIVSSKSGATPIVFDSNGNVGIGTTSPSYKLHIAGVAYASEGLVSDGYISAASTSTSSDIRLKDNISEISSEMALKWLLNLKPKSWIWNSLAGVKGQSMGFVAQDVEAILPQMIRKRRDNDYLSLDYTQLHAIEVSALQSHEKRIEELERENKILKEELNKLKLNAN